MEAECVVTGGEVLEEGIEDTGVGRDFGTSGVDVNGGGNGAPFKSPFTLRFNGGSRIDAPFSFFFPFTPSTPVTALADCLDFASCSSNAC